MKSLEVVNLVKDYQIGKRTVKVLKGVSLTIGIGKVTMIQGASGAGKSTLLQIMAGLDEPTSGDVLLDGGSLFKGCDLPGIRNKRFGFIFNRINFFLNSMPWRTFYCPLLYQANRIPQK